MTIESLIQLIELLVAVGLLLWFFHGPWQSILVDITRQRLFEVRDSILLMAADGRLEFDSDTYRDLRHRLNMSIRLCHKAKFSRMFASAFAMPDENEEECSPPHLLEIISSIEDERVREDLQEKAMEVAGFLANLMVLRSPLLLAVIMLLMPIFLVWELLSGRIKKLISEVGTSIERDIDLENHMCA